MLWRHGCFTTITFWLNQPKKWTSPWPYFCAKGTAFSSCWSAFGTWPASDLRILMVRADSPKSNEKRGFFKVKRRGRMEKSPTTKPTIKQGKLNLYDDTNTNGKWEYWSIIISCFFQQPTSDDDPNVSRGLNHQPYRGTKEIGEARGAIEVSSSSTGYQATCLNQNPVFSLVAN